MVNKMYQFCVILALSLALAAAKTDCKPGDDPSVACKDIPRRCPHGLKFEEPASGHGGQCVILSAASDAVKIDAKNDTMIKESKVIGGDITDISFASSQVAIIIGDILLCSGNIIKDDVVLSVAHCLVNKDIPQLKIRSASKYYNKDGRVVAVLKAKIHSHYVHCKTCYNFDIGLLFLANSATALGIPAVVIFLWDTGTVFAPGTYATVAGWGRTNEENIKVSDTLRSVAVPVAPGYACDFYGPFVSTYNICAGYMRGGKDACKGDSGAGLVIGDKLAGIHAFGQCGTPGKPSGYTSVPIFRNWIRKQINV